MNDFHVPSFILRSDSNVCLMNPSMVEKYLPLFLFSSLCVRVCVCVRVCMRVCVPLTFPLNSYQFIVFVSV